MGEPEFKGLQSRLIRGLIHTVGDEGYGIMDINFLKSMAKFWSVPCRVLVDIDNMQLRSDVVNIICFLPFIYRHLYWANSNPGSDFKEWQEIVKKRDETLELCYLLGMSLSKAT